MPYKARSSVLAAVALSALALSACGGGSDSASDSGMNLVSEGTLPVCSAIPYAP